MKLLAFLLLVAGSLTPVQYEDRTEWRANQARKAHSVHRLPHGPCVARFAEAWAEHLAATGRFHHQDLKRPYSRCHGRYVGEILIGGDVWPRQAVSLWMKSPEHRHILLGPRFDHMGAGAARDASGAWVVSVVFIEH